MKCNPSHPPPAPPPHLHQPPRRKLQTPPRPAKPTGETRIIKQEEEKILKIYINKRPDEEIINKTTINMQTTSPHPTAVNCGPGTHRDPPSRAGVRRAGRGAGRSGAEQRGPRCPCARPSTRSAQWNVVLASGSVTSPPPAAGGRSPGAARSGRPPRSEPRGAERSRTTTPAPTGPRLRVPRN